MSLLPDVLGIKTALIAGAVSLVLGAAGGAYAGYRWELGAYEGRVAADAQALTVAVQQALDKQKRIAAGNQSDAVAEAYFKGKLDAQTLNLVLGVPANVTIAQDTQAAAADHAGCVTYGFVRVLVAGERGVTADSLAYPGGESADSCTAYEPSALASAIAQDLADGFGNSHQLDALIAAVKRNDGIATGAP